MKILEVLLLVIGAIFRVLSTICAAAVLKFTPLVTVVLVVLEVLNITNYGIWTVIGYGVLIYFIAWLIIVINQYALAMFTSK